MSARAGRERALAATFSQAGLRETLDWSNPTTLQYGKNETGRYSSSTSAPLRDYFHSSYITIRLSL